MTLLLRRAVVAEMGHSAGMLVSLRLNSVESQGLFLGESRGGEGGLDWMSRGQVLHEPAK